MKNYKNVFFELHDFLYTAFELFVCFNSFLTHDKGFISLYTPTILIFLDLATRKHTYILESFLIFWYQMIFLDLHNAIAKWCQPYYSTPF